MRNIDGNRSEEKRRKQNRHERQDWVGQKKKAVRGSEAERKRERERQHSTKGEDMDRRRIRQ